MPSYSEKEREKMRHLYLTGVISKAAWDNKKNVTKRKTIRIGHDRKVRCFGRGRNPKLHARYLKDKAKKERYKQRVKERKERADSELPEVQ